MSETKTDKEKEPVNTERDNDNGDKPNEATLINQADKAAERLERANEERKRLIEREEAIEARRRLGGSIEIPKETKKPETNKEYVERILREGYPDRV